MAAETIVAVGNATAAPLAPFASLAAAAAAAPPAIAATTAQSALAGLVVSAALSLALALAVGAGFALGQRTRPSGPARAGGRRIVIVDGLIGAGKSTFLSYLEREGYEVLQEPLDQWRALDGQFNLLEDFYRDPDRYGTVFQMFTLITRWIQFDGWRDRSARGRGRASLRANPRPDLLFIERGVLGDSVFAEVMFRRGTISAAWKAVYDATFQQICRSMPPIAQVLWIDTRPEDALARMRERNRGEEVAGVSLEYLADLYAAASRVYDGLDVPRLVVPSSVDFRAPAPSDAAFVARNLIRA